MKKFWEKLNLKWRLRHPVEGIVKPLIREFWRQTKVVGLNLWWAIGHTASLIRNLDEIVFSWLGVVALIALGVWGAFVSVWLTIPFWKIVMAFMLLDVISWIIAQAPEAWKEKTHA